MDQTLVEDVSVKKLLESGVHFGHHLRRWNPKFKRFIYTEKNGIHIIDVIQTLDRLKVAERAVREVIERGKDILFVGTKQQAKEVIRTEAERAEVPYVTERWVGGLLTNFKMVYPRIKKFAELEYILSTDAERGKYSMKELVKIERMYNKMKRLYGGLKRLENIPGMVFIIDPTRETTALNEAKILGIPVISLIDTNGDPDLIDYPIPGNDDAMKSIHVITKVIADSVLEAKQSFFETTTDEEEA